MEKIEVRELIILGTEVLSKVLLQLRFLSEFLGHFQTKFFKPDNIPPILTKDDLRICLKHRILGDNYFSELHRCLPNIIFVIPKINLVSALTFKVYVKPFGELTR